MISQSGKDELELFSTEEHSKLLSIELGRLLKTLHTFYGAVTLVRGASIENAKEFNAGINALAWCIRLIPYIMPSEWTEASLLETLAKYSYNTTTHHY